MNSSFTCNYSIITDNHNSDNETILYYFYGSGGSEQTWIDKHKKIVKYWIDKKKPVPVVVTISFGKSWLLKPRSAEKNSGKLEFFINDFMPTVEKKINGNIRKRYLMGVSMGGYSAAQLVFRYPRLFNKCAIISPLIFPASVYNNKEVREEFLSRFTEKDSGINNFVNFFLVNFNKRPIKQRRMNYLVWWGYTNLLNEFADPPLVKKPSIYISCGDQDENGFYPGTVELAEKAISKGYNVKLNILSGRHDAIDENEIADFFIR